MQDLPSPSPPLSWGLTAIAGLRVGHDSLEGRPTGCTVVLAEGGIVAGVDVRGGAPGSRELALLDPVQTVDRVHGLVLAGGSAFGLESVTGVVRWLEEQGEGFVTPGGRVPIVPAAILFDLAVGGDPRVRPDAESGYRAAAAARSVAVAEGNVGAGAGATVVKLLGMERAMKGGVGSVARELENGLRVAALFAVNAVGDVIDPDTGTVVAGARTADGGGLQDLRRWLRRGRLLTPPIGNRGEGLNTTLGIVATNAALTKAQATKLAQMAHDGLARTIHPAHTPWDGDTIFTLATGEREVGDDFLSLGALAAEVSAAAILRGVRAADSLPGLPGATDLHSNPDHR